MHKINSKISKILLLATAIILIIEPAVDIYVDKAAFLHHMGGSDFPGCRFDITHKIMRSSITTGIIIAFTLLTRDILSKTIVLILSISMLIYTIHDSSPYKGIQHCDELLMGDGLIQGGICLAIILVCIFSFIVGCCISRWKYFSRNRNVP